MCSRGSMPPSNGIPLVDAYGGPRDGLRRFGTVGFGLDHFLSYLGVVQRVSDPFDRI
jgi:hypothetical protein